MKRYWDTSAVLEILRDAKIEKKSREPQQYTRTHTLSELFSSLTNGRLGWKLLPDEAAETIEEITAPFLFVDMDKFEALNALKEAKHWGVMGGAVHDWMHARAAKKAQVSELLTLNLTDFQILADGFKVREP